MRISDWSSDVCSSDLGARRGAGGGRLAFPATAPADRARQFGRDARCGIDRADRLFPDLRRSRPRGRWQLEGQDRLRLARDGADPGRQQLWRSEEHTSELQSLMRISYAVFCLKKQKAKLE